MGLATILIIVCHMPAHGVVMPNLVSKAIQYGALGVDIFLFLSGMGIYCSLKQNTEKGKSLMWWYMRRLLRIYVPWLLFAIPFYLFQNGSDWNIVDYVLIWSCFAFWVNGDGLWFVALVVVLYLISPFFLKMCRSRRKWLYAGFLILVTWLLGSIYGLDGMAEHLRFGLCRIPSYVLGFVMAEDIIQKRYYPTKLYLGGVLLVLAIALIVRFVLHVKLSLFWLQGMLLLIICGILVCKLKSNVSHRFLDFMGSISLESYFTNVCLLICFQTLSWNIGGRDISYGNWTYYIVGTLVCIVVAYVIHYVSTLIIKKVNC